MLVEFKNKRRLVLINERKNYWLNFIDNYYFYVLKYIKNQDEETCLDILDLCGDELKYVKNQTVALCLAAIEENPESAKFVKIILK
jgi:hypothetical protein